MSPGTAHPVAVATGRDPYQVMFLFGAGVAGVTMIATGLVPRAMEESELPRLLVYVWEGMLALGSFGCLLGTWWRGDLETGRIIEAGGHGMVASMLAFFVAVILTFNPSNALAVGMFIGSVAVAAVWRFIQIFRQLRRLDQARRAGATTTLTLLVDPDKP